METLNVPQGEFQLSRYPVRKDEKLRAWDAADEYLLNYFSENNSLLDNARKILIINDGFGALAAGLSQYNITAWNDSYLAQQGVLNNFSKNNLDDSHLQQLTSIEIPADNYDAVLIKIPKSLALLEDQLARIKPLLQFNTTIIAAGMVKTIHTSTLKLFEKYIGDTKTSLAKKKARLIFSTVNKGINTSQSPYPKKYVLEKTDYNIVNHANVFSRESLDIGTRFFIQHIPTSERYEKIIDLGCGNGIVGLIAAEKNPQAELLFIDSSYMAVESAKQTYENASLTNPKVIFKAGDCLSEVKKNSADLILNNPPFHQDNSIGDETAWKMFKQSKEVLKKNGELLVIGNRHLGYHVKLKKVFGNCEVIATNKKFVILKSVKV